MKNIQTLLLSCLLTVLVSSCDTPSTATYNQAATKEYREKQELKEKHGNLLKLKAKEVHEKINRLISPQSGRNFEQIVEIDNITLDKTNNELSVNALFRWQARDFWTSVPYGTCEVSGTLYVQLPKSAASIQRTTFMPTDYNTHLKRVSAENDFKKLLKGIVVD